MKQEFTPDPDVDYTRTVIQRGAYVRICGWEPRRHSGGGKRGAQHGHNQRCERRLKKYLMGCKQPDMVIWLTYPDIRGPIGVKKHIDAFLGRLERRIGYKLGALTKMELQKRLSPELGILIWNPGESDIGMELVCSLWHDTTKAEGRVIVEHPRSWLGLANYISKRIEVTESEIIRGAERIPFSQLKEGADSNLVIRAHNHEIPEQINLPFSNPYLSSIESIQAKEEWIAYTGRFYWKHGEAFIPVYDEKVTEINSEQAAIIRRRINSKRKEHFVGNYDPMSLLGADALEVTKELGLNSHIDSPASSDAQVSTATPPSNSPVLSGKTFPILLQEPVRIPHVEDVIQEGREACSISHFLLPWRWPSLRQPGRYTNSIPERNSSFPLAKHGPQASDDWLREMTGRHADGADLEPTGDDSGTKPSAASWAAIMKAASSTHPKFTSSAPVAPQACHQAGKNVMPGLLGIEEWVRGFSLCCRGATGGGSESVVQTASHDNVAGSQSRHSCRSPGSWHSIRHPGGGQAELPHGRRQD